MYQESLKNSSLYIISLVEIGNPNTCFISSSTQRVVNYGSTDNMIGNSSLFSISQSSISPTFVTLADEFTSSIIRYGTVHPTSQITLLYVLNLQKVSFNLASMSKITNTLNSCLIFSYLFLCFFQFLDLLKHTVAWVILYYLYLKKLCLHLKSLSSLDYESYQFANHHHLPSVSCLNKQASSRIELAHSEGGVLVQLFLKLVLDILLPLFIFFQNDLDIFYEKSFQNYSLILQLFVLKSKLNLIYLFVLCTAMMQKNIFLTRLILMCLIMAFFMNPLVLIVHLKIVSLKGKNRHILKTVKALLFHMYVPKAFQADVVCTAFFLINCMPSSVISGDTPYHTIFLCK